MASVSHSMPRRLLRSPDVVLGLHRRSRRRHPVRVGAFIWACVAGPLAGAGGVAWAWWPTIGLGGGGGGSAGTGASAAAVAVPEPSSFALLLAALVFLAGAVALCPSESSGQRLSPADPARKS